MNGVIDSTAFATTDHLVRCVVTEQRTTGTGSSGTGRNDLPVNYSPALIDKMEATTPSNWYRAVEPTSRGVEIAPWFRRLNVIRDIAQKWSDEAEPPNAQALHGARRVLELLFDYNFCPSAISPSCEGGVLVTFEVGDRQASIEADNDGEMVAVISDKVNRPDAWMVFGDAAIRHTLERFSTHLA